MHMNRLLLRHVITLVLYRSERNFIAMTLKQNMLLRIYLYCCLGVFVSLTLVHLRPLNQDEIIVILVIGLVAIWFEWRPILLPSGEELSLVSPLLFTSSVLYGFFPTACILLGSTIILACMKPSSWKPILFNGAQYALSVYVALQVYQLAGGIIGTLDLNNVLSYSLYILCYQVMNFLFVTIFMYISTQTFISTDFKSNIIYLNLMALATLVTKVIEQGEIIGIVLFVIVLWGLGISYRTYYAMYNDFKILSIKDGLTNLYNHRHFQEKVEEVVVLDREVSLLLIDLDLFKLYNDQFGHPEGDKLLKEISKLLLDQTPKNVDAFRYGGEEFALILPDFNQTEALALAEKLRQAIAERDFYGADSMEMGHITVSIGISTYPEMADTKEQFIKNADLALYEAKKMRNNVVTYSPGIERVSELVSR
ncbi:GGDEF domain-containing protein [Guptibacillus hwajinpoensis]|uniref:Diguanylate cyclase (GGDEF)-like protein n=1 Tax=Guptibacillus hwajinpoensis TaxID=208199 RepID=A0ABU0JZT2_9BACL|nr:GGDEF domain-containing protein [Alkalihalobacillus hemicentroti]MDQ0482549.1 diguanylate cyclase (GGDEF)-like protein [Alkalihalobacillus hemicentroti]